jgi:hypothetical protein
VFTFQTTGILNAASLILFRSFESRARCTRNRRPSCAGPRFIKNFFGRCAFAALTVALAIRSEHGQRSPDDWEGAGVANTIPNV